VMIRRSLFVIPIRTTALEFVLGIAQSECQYQ
jgi:hypothetical protein